MRKKKIFSKISDVLKVPKLIFSGVRLNHDRMLYLQVRMNEAENKSRNKVLKFKPNEIEKTISHHKLGFCT